MNKKNKEYCIIRTYSAGVFAGYFNRKKKGKEGTIYDARNIWYWKGASSIHQLAIDGTNCPNECKFTKTVDELDLKEIIEVIPCTPKAKKSIIAVKEWKM